MEKRFRQLFGQSWQEYKSNFWLFVKIFALFGVLPAIMVALIRYVFPQINFTNLTNLSDFSQMLSVLMPALIFTVIFWIIIFILNVIIGISFIYIGFYGTEKNKLTMGQAIGNPLKYFWRYLGLAIVLFFAFIGLFLLLIIPGVIFAIYWIFAYYILIKENTRIVESMRRSKAIVKGRWWKVFGFSLLFVLIIIGISIVVSIPSIIYYLVIGLTKTTFIGTVLDYLTSWITFIILTPLYILFFKNLYLDLRTNLTSKNKK